MKNRSLCSIVLLTAAWLLLAASYAMAQTTATPVTPGYLSTTGCASRQTVCFVPYGPLAPITGTVTANQGTAGASPWPVMNGVSAVTGTVSAKTITNSSAQVLAASSRQLLAIDNESATASIACAFGATAALNTAGSFTLPPQSTRTWTSYPVPAAAVNCISSAATSPATVEVN